MHTHEVLRSFDADRPLRPKERVDATNWPNRALLESQGLIRSLRPNEIGRAQNGKTVTSSAPSTEEPTSRGRKTKRG